jgi:hypothetical protein
MKYKVMYHVSPNNFDKITPHYRRVFKEKGIFLTNYHSGIVDWMSYVFNKEDRENYDVHYSYVLLYKILMPETIFKKCEENYNKVYNSKKWSESVLFDFWWWGYQLFIPERYCKYLVISGRKKFTFGQMVRETNRLLYKQYKFDLYEREKRNKTK